MLPQVLNILTSEVLRGRRRAGGICSLVTAEQVPDDGFAFTARQAKVHDGSIRWGMATKDLT